jgi:hypothetical protein
MKKIDNKSTIVYGSFSYCSKVWRISLWISSFGAFMAQAHLIVKGLITTGYGEKAFFPGSHMGNFLRTLGDKEVEIRLSLDSFALLNHLQG